MLLGRLRSLTTCFKRLRSLAELIRADKVHAICCTGANLEEDVFNLVAHDHYERIPNWRNLTPEQEKKIQEILQQPVTWAAPHIGADGRKSWADVATEEMKK